jgi:hypothetical protein
MTKLQQRIIGLGFLGLIFAIISCDPYGGYEYWIDNKSDSVIFVVLHETYADEVERITIDQKSMILLKKYETIDGLHDYRDDFLQYWDSLSVMIDTTSRLVIKKDFSKRDSWTYDQNKTGLKSGDNIYRLEIKNEDLK